MKRLVLVDGYSVLNRAFHALPIFTTRDGQPTNAIYGFLATFFKVTDDLKPTHVLVALDRPGKTFRHEVFTEYKGTRAEAADALVQQMRIFEDVLKGLGIPALGKSGFEADDIIGTVSALAERDGVSADILTGDKDLLQLVSSQTQVLLMRGGDRIERMDREGVKGLLGVSPEQVPDLKSLTGDTSDNIPGVRGIGDKSATKLLEGDLRLEDLLDRPDDLPPGRAKDLLLKATEIARLSKHLATIVRDLPLEVTLEDLAYRRPQGPEALELLKHLEFKSLITRLGLKEEVQAPRGLFSAERPPGAPKEAFLDEKRLALSFSGDKVAVRGDGKEGLFSMEGAREILASDIPKAAHSAKPELRRLAVQGFPVEGLTFDTALAAYLLNPSQEGYPLEDLAARHLDVSFPLGEDGLPDRAGAIYLLEDSLREELSAQGLLELFETVEMPLLLVLLAMELNGVAVDREALMEMSRELGEGVEGLTQRITELAGGPFNINSTQQLREILFERLGLPVIKRTKTGPSTDAEVLEELAPRHEIVALILEYRQMTKLKSTYTDGLLPLIADDGKIHATFGQMVASTGRLSCSDPNLQNIPIRLEAGRRLRKVFRPSAPDRLLVTADYSQIELRVLAHLSGDTTMLEAFATGQDIHTQTASEVFGLSPAEVTSDLRRKAKAVNFGIVYGISDFGLARDLGIAVPEAKEIIFRYFDRYPGVKAYLEGAVAQATDTGYASTLLGRRRYLPDLHHRNRTVRSFAERTAMNTPIQGSAADILKVAMVRAFRELEAAGKTDRMLLSVHDELIFEAEEGEVPWMATMVKESMEGAVRLDIPLLVDVKVGPTWYDVRPLEMKDA